MTTLLSFHELPVLLQLAIEKYRRDGAYPLFYAFLRRAQKTLIRSETLFIFMTKIRFIKQQYRYNAPAHPYKTIDVATDRVDYFNESINTHWGFGLIKDGEWDRSDNCRPIVDTTHYRGLEQRFEGGLDWEETVYYQERLQNEFFGELTNHDKRRVDYFEQLYRDIRRNGYRPNYDSGHDAPEGGSRQGGLQHVHALEPIVTIGKNGEIYLNEGFHRFAIAKFLDIERIPVNVLARHKKWQDVRERINAASYPESDRDLKEYLSHPDIQDILVSSRSDPNSVPVN